MALVWEQLKRCFFQIVNLPSPWENCGSISLPGFYGYSSAACRQVCKREYVLKKCGCHDVSMAHTDNSALCHPGQHDCVEQAKDEYEVTDPPCSLYCPVPCKEELFSTLLSYAPLSTHYMQSLVDQYGQDIEYWRENIVQLNIYYEDMVEERVYHQPAYSVLSLLCDCGGAFGLVIGASLTSLIQLADFIIRRSVSFCK